MWDNDEVKRALFDQIAAAVDTGKSSDAAEAAAAAQSAQENMHRLWNDPELWNQTETCEDCDMLHGTREWAEAAVSYASGPEAIREFTWLLNLGFSIKLALFITVYEEDALDIFIRSIPPEELRQAVNLPFDTFPFGGPDPRSGPIFGPGPGPGPGLLQFLS